MKWFTKILIKGISLLGVVFTLKLAFSSGADSFHYFDIRAALLVFAMPVFVLILFEKEGLNWRHVTSRARETVFLDIASLRKQLSDQTSAATGQYSTSHLLKMTENHRDSFVRFAGGLVTARFNSEEISRLLAQRIEAEDHQWSSVGETFGFMAKMAPYFGMLATVIGMVKLLENMSDFTKISGSMALAMQGTLYGLVSFTLLYSPLLKLLSGWREQIRKRNEMIAHWFILVSSRAESAYIREDLHSSAFLDSNPETTAVSSKLHTGLKGNA